MVPDKAGGNPEEFVILEANYHMAKQGTEKCC